VSRGDARVMAGLMTAAVPPLQPAELIGHVIEDLPGRVVSCRWPGRRTHLQRRPHCVGNAIRHYRLVRTRAEGGRAVLQ